MPRPLAGLTGQAVWHYSRACSPRAAADTVVPALLAPFPPKHKILLALFVELGKWIEMAFKLLTIEDEPQATRAGRYYLEREG